MTVQTPSNGPARGLLRLDVQALDEVDPDRPLLAHHLFEIAAVARGLVDAERVEDLLDALGLAPFDHQVGEPLHDLGPDAGGPDQADPATDLKRLLGQTLLVEGRDVRQLARAR